MTQAWQARAAAARLEGFPYVHTLINEGRDAGSSLVHSHSQLVWLRETPPVVAEERALASDRCPVCTALAEAQDRLVAQRGGVVSLCPSASRLPYELLVAPAAHGGDPFTSRALAAALQLGADGLRRLHAIEGPSPANAWLHAGGHWHLEIVPRLAVLAGIELGAGYYINSLPPEEAAAALRGVAERERRERRR